MKGVAASMIVVAVAAIFITVLIYNYNQEEQVPTLPTGRAVTDISTSGTGVQRLGFLDSCNPNRDTCDAGLVCKLDRENVYRCLKIS